MFKSILALACTMLLFTNNANAFQIKDPVKFTKERIEKDVGIFNISGTIDQDTADASHKAFGHFVDANVAQIVVHLNSYGGQLSAGKSIMKDIQDAERLGIEVISLVDHEEVCASMCTGIFAVADSRMAAFDTVWIFHSPYVKLSDRDKKDPFEVKRAHDTIEEARVLMLEIYKQADPVWTKKELTEHVNTPNNPLIVTGADILNRSPTWINVVVGD